jgi:transposase
MPRALPIELRERIARASVEGGMAVDEIAEIFAVSRNSVKRCIAKHKKGLSLEPGVPPGAEPKLGEPELEWLQAALKSDPYTTSYELTTKFNKMFRTNQVHRSTILRAMHKLGFTYKKRRPSRLSATGKMFKQPGNSSRRTRTPSL